MTDIKQQGGMGSTNNQYVNVYTSPDSVKSPSIISKMIQVLSESSEINKVDFKQLDDDFVGYDIDDKLEHNKVVKYYDLITHYYEYMSLVENGYEAISDYKPNGREIILRSINREYKKAVGEMLKQNNVSPKNNERVMDVIRANSDALIDSVIDFVTHICVQSEDAGKYLLEDVQVHAEYLVFHAFVECKVLEKPL